MQFKVSEKKQFTPLSYIVRYDAELKILPNNYGVHVEIINTVPVDADAADVTEAREAVIRGVRKAMESRGHGAIVRLKDFVIHPVDFNPAQFERVTAIAVRQALEINAQSSSDAGNVSSDTLPRL